MRRGGPRRGDSPLPAALEIWLIGSPYELGIASRTLASVGRVLDAGARHPLEGADTGRHQVYARVHVTHTTTPPIVYAASECPGPVDTDDEVEFGDEQLSIDYQG